MSLAGKTILCVFAHPDDESLACGGTLARASDLGARVVVFCASRGEAGSTSDPSLVPDGDLGLVRMRELSLAARALGIAEIVVMNHPDGELRWNQASDMQLEIAETVKRYRADGVVTFAEDGLYWHADHIGLHEHTTAAVESLGGAAPPLYYVMMPPGAMPCAVAAARAKPGAPADVSLWGIAPEIFGHAAPLPTITVDVRDWAARKLAALRCHRTQVGASSPFAWLDEDDARRCLGTEHFRRAPVKSAGADLLETLHSSNPQILKSLDP